MDVAKRESLPLILVLKGHQLNNGICEAIYDLFYKLHMSLDTKIARLILFNAFVALILNHNVIR